MLDHGQPLSGANFMRCTKRPTADLSRSFTRFSLNVDFDIIKLIFFLLLVIYVDQQSESALQSKKMREGVHRIEKRS